MLKPTRLSRPRVVFAVLVSLSCRACSSFALWGGRQSQPASASISSAASVPSSSAAAAAAAAATATSSTELHAAAKTHKPQRGQVLEDPVRADDLFRAYQDVQQEYQERAFHSKDWKVLNRKDGVEVAMLQHPSDPTCPYIRLKGEFPVSVEDCWNFLLVSEWDRTMPKMDPFYEGVSTHGEFFLKPRKKVPSMILCRKRTKRILAFGKRDLVFVSVHDTPLDDGTWVSGSVSVVTPSIPRQKGYTRAFQDSIAFYKPTDNGQKTVVTIVCRIDLNDSGAEGAGGFVPMWVYVKTIGLTGLNSVIGMRNALMEDQAERRKQQEEEEQQRLLLQEQQQQQAAQADEGTKAAKGPWWKRRNQ